MGALENLLLGFSVALTPINLFWCLIGVILGTVVGVLPGLGPAATIAMLLPLDAQDGSHHGNYRTGGDLLRRALRRLDNFHPSQHSGRIIVGGHLSGWLPVGAPRQGRSSVRDFCGRVIRRRHHRHIGIDANCAAVGPFCIALCSAGIFRLDGFGPRDGGFLGGQVDDQGSPGNAGGPVGRYHRHRSFYR